MIDSERVVWDVECGIRDYYPVRGKMFIARGEAPGIRRVNDLPH